jgi:hypothetical protein
MISSFYFPLKLNIVVQYIWDNMGYSISQEKILTKSKKNNNLTKLHTSHAASTTPTAAPTRITVGAFLFVTRGHYVSFSAKRIWENTKK